MTCCAIGTNGILIPSERYIKGLAPEWQFASDPYLVKNIFPEDASKKAAQLGMVFPD